FGPQYTAATGTSLLEGYRKQGRWPLWLFAILTAATMFSVQAAVTVVTAGLAIVLFGLEASPVAVSGVLMAVCAGLLRIGEFRWLDRAVKALVVVLSICTFVSTALALSRVDFSQSLVPSATVLSDDATIFFIAALVGWMPAPIDISVWQSLWTLARQHDTGHRATLKETLLDYHIGYVGTGLLALCFMLMGAGVMYGSGIEFAEAAGPFASQIIALYTTTLGPWSGPIVAIAAFAVMFSTTLTVIDGFARAVAVLLERLKGPESSEAVEPAAREGTRVYWATLASLALGALAVLSLLTSSLKAMVDIATTASFLTAPLLAVLNHRAVHGPEVPPAFRPSSGLWAMSWAGIVFLTTFAGYYVWLRYL
ncbi:MAG: divalent metal cation transporter, partial [Polyangiaceae bacterium]|nr:divalent metal cation transporter [Polyangiaceae bacterium]